MSRFMTGAPLEPYSAAVGEMSSKSRAMPSTKPAPTRTWMPIRSGSSDRRASSCQRSMVREPPTQWAGPRRTSVRGRARATVAIVIPPGGRRPTRAR
jgi:hypothetical protein